MRERWWEEAHGKIEMRVLHKVRCVKEAGRLSMG